MHLLASFKSLGLESDITVITVWLELKKILLDNFTLPDRREMYIDNETKACIQAA